MAELRWVDPSSEATGTRGHKITYDTQESSVEMPIDANKRQQALSNGRTQHQNAHKRDTSEQAGERQSYGNSVDMGDFRQKKARSPSTRAVTQKSSAAVLP